MRTIVVLNRKGGVGKTTTINALGYGLMKKRKKVLFVDCDGQSNLTLLLGAKETTAGSYDLIMNNTDIHDLIQKTPEGDIIAACENLQAVDVELALKGKKFLQNAPQILLMRLREIANEYDYVLIDTPAALNVITEMCLAAANKTIIPINPDILSLQGIPRVFEAINFVKENYNPDLIADGFLLTKYSDRNPINRYMKEQLEAFSKEYNTKIYKTQIRECISLKEAQASMQSINEYAPNSTTTIDYAAFLNEFLKGEKA